jgi:phosphoribosylanthranilate isomerase
MERMAPFRIKICGVTLPEDAAAAAEAGADAIGLNFYRGSPRYVDPRQAEAIIAALPPGLSKVGVFVNSGANELRQTAEKLALDYVQLHGDEPAEFLGQLNGLPIIRAFRFGMQGWQALVEYLAECRSLKALPMSILVDGYSSSGDYGGTGQSPDWQAVRQFHDLGTHLPLILAGGLNPSNVAQAIMTVRPMAVDVASGVESRPGKKDWVKVSDFVAAAREAFRSCQVG